MQYKTFKMCLTLYMIYYLENTFYYILKKHEFGQNDMIFRNHAFHALETKQCCCDYSVGILRVKNNAGSYYLVTIILLWLLNWVWFLKWDQRERKKDKKD